MEKHAKSLLKVIIRLNQLYALLGSVIANLAGMIITLHLQLPSPPTTIIDPSCSRNWNILTTSMSSI
ncbi:hypothetical protein OWV82_001105 [Melia azedarach]|uniref:Uncharacterized protein n=1 Tax=Melia azedarach TaxID=155640 RepID=A0ACC1YY29_MELAZ|nr:hypothetical protein OWV82_001105 [Melia azedarach]